MTPPSTLYAQARLSYVTFTAPEVMRYIMLGLECIPAPQQAAQQIKKQTKKHLEASVFGLTV